MAPLTNSILKEGIPIRRRLPLESRFEQGRLIQIGKKLGIKEGEYEAWYGITAADIIPYGAASLLRAHNKSISSLVSSAFPGHQWDLLRFSKKPQGYWSSTENKRRFLLEVGAKLSIRANDFEAWYKFGKSDLLRYRGGALLKIYNFSYSSLLADVFKEHVWDPKRFRKMPSRALNSDVSRRNHLFEIGSQLGIAPENLEGWYKVSGEDLRRAGERGLLRRYNGSLVATLKNIFPDHEWDLDKFSRKPQKGKQPLDVFTRKGVREAVIQIGEKLGISSDSFDEWYEVSPIDFKKFGGEAVCKRYEDSVFRILQDALPEVKWEAARFVNSPRDFWSSRENQRAFMDQMVTELGLKGHPEFWGSIQKKDLHSRIQGRTLLDYYEGSIPNLLQSIYPENSKA